MIQFPADGELGWLFVTDRIMLYYNKRALPWSAPNNQHGCYTSILAICGPVIFVGFDEKATK
ncbi:hypothetical protein [Shouchella lonarensis]|uniref:hypothetical protein n=1 Tax=Shouchella lonarensis TaxID=1464122 RepID=UPI00114D3EC7|nr:hypothetical protein [Shouchella lonarensis]